ncbi:hypothetical protein QWY14_14735 [Planococcus sp. N028]|uniref:Tissue inhibitor of metalloproteinase n=1 Tax=Planococcus shixiaomingii TaxID=3058393 RepID=A0ABT8N591_9BACL|nr:MULTISPECIES: hypothetical protein [unclassified Planococcus (in: firmicutes)]MDN7243057.1 hypothetical protein [Planococcus sp. N028]WKA55003.1 hypothetical protein QWY21_01100 [Planococcus sp. N022]
MKKACLLVLIAVIFAGVFSFPTAPKACSCAQSPGVEDEVSRSKAVFAGTVLNVQEKRPFFGAPSKSALFEVEEIWKGVEQSQIIVRTGSGDGDCGSEFQEGAAYLVYAGEPSLYSGFHEFETVICSRTSELGSAQEDLAVLGAGTPPTEQVNLASQENRQTIFMWIVSFLIVGVSAVYILLKRKKA